MEKFFYFMVYHGDIFVYMTIIALVIVAIWIAFYIWYKKHFL
jgi:hypothetical protein